MKLDEHEPSTNTHEEHTQSSPTPKDDPNPSATVAVEPPKRKPRGFAAMDRKLVSEIARKGGKAAHSAGTAHEFTTDEARQAGRKGGLATHAKRNPQGAPQQQPVVTEAPAPADAPADRASQRDTLH